MHTLIFPLLGKFAVERVLNSVTKSDMLSVLVAAHKGMWWEHGLDKEDGLTVLFLRNHSYLYRNAVVLTLEMLYNTAAACHYEMERSVIALSSIQINKQLEQSKEVSFFLGF